MLRLALTNLRANATRLLATATAVVVGVAFLAAGLMLTTAMKDELDGDVAEQYRAVDVAVRPGGGLEGLGGLVSPVALAVVRSTPGVAAADGELTAPARLLRPDDTPLTPRSIGRAWLSDRQLNPLTVVDGRAPRAGDEVAIDRRTADDAGLEVGDVARVGTPEGPVRLRVVGTTRFGDQDRLDDGGTLSFTPSAASRLLNGDVPGSSNVLVRAEPGRRAEVVERLRAELPGTLDVLTGTRFRANEQAQASGFVDVLRPVLQGFAYLALFVTAFVIFNTFSVVVTQRSRELALVRAVGGTPGQVRRGLLTEGLLIGLAASVVGMVAGALLAWGATAVLGAFGVEVPGGGVAVTPWTVLLCLALGTVVTVLSAVVPAVRAGRTRPVEAMRAGEVDTSGTSRTRAIVGGAALVLSLSLLLVHRTLWPRWYLLAPGALLLFVGLVVGGPLLARLFALLAGPLLRPLGVTARLAVDNTVRNPRRTATTANALVIGLFLVTLVTVAGDALKTVVVDQLNELSSSDYIVAGDGAPLDPVLVRRVAAVDGVAASAPVRTTTVLDDRNRIVILSGADVAALRRTTGLEVANGSLDGVADGRGVALVDLSEFGGANAGGGDAGPGESRSIAPFGGRVGDRLVLISPDGAAVEVPVVATLRAKLDTLFLGRLLSPEAFERVAGDRPVTQVFVRATPDRLDDVGVGLERAVRGFAGVDVKPGNFIGAAVAQFFDRLIGAVNALLGMSVLIALIGVVNTLTLSIFERRRELGMVRALGMTRGQVATMVRLEAVLIAVLGTLVGVGTGLLLGWVMVGGLGDGRIDLSLSWSRLALIVGAGVLAGVLASLLPSRRALRIDMLEAMRAT